MPYVSNAERRWAHTAAGMKALGGPEKVHEWDMASKGMKLPERAKPSKGSSMRSTQGSGRAKLRRKGR